MDDFWMADFFKKSGQNMNVDSTICVAFTNIV